VVSIPDLGGFKCEPSQGQSVVSSRKYVNPQCSVPVDINLD